MRLRSIVAALAFVAVGTLGVAIAHDHRAPRATLRIDGERVAGALWSSSWVSRDGRYCVLRHSDGALGFRSPLELAPGTYQASIRLVKRQRPLRLRIHAYTEFDGAAPEGSPERIPYTLAPVVGARGRRSWVASFEVTVTPEEPRVLLDALGRWGDVDGCGGSEEASWGFSLRSEG
jgi:hypothetical protein